MKSLTGIFLVTISTPALAQHDHGAAVQQAPADPHAEHQMDEQSADPHAGHDMPPKPSEPTDPHAGHQMPSSAPTDAHQAHAGHEPGIPDPPVERSEEHTSELQSLMRISYAVFCLKKKKKNIRTIQK